MTTIYDLADRYQMSPDAVRGWLRKRGLGGRKGNQVTDRAMQAFRKAHGGGAQTPSEMFGQLAPAPAPPQSSAPHYAQPPPQQFPPQYAAPAPTPVAPSPALEGFYRRKHDEVMAQYRAAQEEITTLRAQLAKAQKRASRKVVKAEPEPTDVQTLPLGEALEAAGFVGDARRSALRALVASPKGAAALLDGAQIEPEAIARVRPVCNDPACQRVSTLDGTVAVRVSASRCAVCKGSTNQRWFGLMARLAVRNNKARILVVGGADDTHAAVKRLCADHPKLRLTLVAGNQKTTRQRARTKVRGADVVVFWASTMLDHAVSGVYKDAAMAQDNVTSVVVAKGGRGVKSMARAVVEAIDR